MIQYLIARFLGIAFMFLCLANEARKDFKAAGAPFVFKNFLRDELINISIHVVALLILAITVDEWGNYNALVTKYITCLFALGGIVAPFIISLIASKSKKYARTVADIKSNIVDNELGQSKTITELKEKAIDSGKDITAPKP